MMNRTAFVRVIFFVTLFMVGPWLMQAEPPASPEAETERRPEKHDYEVTELVEKYLREAPPEEIRNLKSRATAPRAAAELTRYFSKTAINQQVVVHVKVAAAQANLDAQHSFRVGPKTERVKWEGGSMNLLSWLYFHGENAAQFKDARVGSEITVNGVVRRCEIVVIQGSLRFNFDLWECSIETHR